MCCVGPRPGSDMLDAVSKLCHALDVLTSASSCPKKYLIGAWSMKPDECIGRHLKGTSFGLQESTPYVDPSSGTVWPDVFVPACGGHITANSPLFAVSHIGDLHATSSLEMWLNDPNASLHIIEGNYGPQTPEYCVTYVAPLVPELPASTATGG